MFEKVFPFAAAVSLLLFISGLISFFGDVSPSNEKLPTNASEGLRIEALKELIGRGETSYKYETNQLPPPMASQ